MSIEKITSKIIGEAEEKKKAVLADAKEKVDRILAAAREEADQYLAAEVAKGEEAKATLISRHHSVAEIDCRKLILQKKQELLDACFVQAIKATCELPEAEYVELLVNLGKASGVKKGILFFNEKDKAAVGAKVCAALSEAVAEGNFAVAEEPKAIAGGFILQSGNVYINNSIEALVAEHKEIMISEAHKVMFE